MFRLIQNGLPACIPVLNITFSEKAAQDGSTQLSSQQHKLLK